MGKQKEAIKMAIKDEILGRFRKMKAKSGDVLAPAWLYDDLMANLSAKEQRAFEEIVNEMIQQGLLEYVGGAKPTYAITQKGLDILC